MAVGTGGQWRPLATPRMGWSRARQVPGAKGTMLVVNRFRVPPARAAAFRAQAEAALVVLRSKPGLQGLELVQNLDDPQLWALVGHWANVGSYRRALGGMESKMTVVPLLSLAIDEPSAYDLPGEVGQNLPREAD